MTLWVNCFKFRPPYSVADSMTGAIKRDSSAAPQNDRIADEIVPATLRNAVWRIGGLQRCAQNDRAGRVVAEAGKWDCLRLYI